MALRSARRIAYIGAPTAGAITLLVLIAIRGETIFSPGKLSSGHSALSNECGRCHLGGPRAMSAGCLDCHAHVVDADRIESAALHGAEHAVFGPACATCHLEHGETATDRACVDCHGREKNPIASLEAHREVKPRPESGTITFDHSLHTGAITEGARATQLTCQRCHRIDAGGAYMAPIRFARDCESCHPLEVPHIASSAGNVACSECHRLEGGAIVPSSINDRWYPRARFDHAKHSATAFRTAAVGPNAHCTFCHAAILSSRKADDVSLPDLATCQRCHGQETSGACTSCHTYHRPAGERRPSYDQSDRILVEEGRRETRFGMKAGAALWPLSSLFALPKMVWNKPEVEPGTPEFDRELFDRYGLFPADFENDRLPLGLTRTVAPYDGEPGVTVTCDLCHSSSLFGRIVIGQPNRFADHDRLWIDLGLVSGERGVDPLFIRNPKQNSVVNAADHLALLGLIAREPGLTIEPLVGYRLLTGRAMEFKPELDRMVHLKTPPWYAYRIKQEGAAGYYYDGGYPKDGNFAEFTYLSAFYQFDGNDVRPALARWQRSGHAYLSSIEPPKYPFAIDARRAQRGLKTYDRLCAECHGRSENGKTTFPGIVVPLAKIETDPMRAQFPVEFARRMKMILGETYTLTGGYVAPPLVAIWAQAPYLHNGSVPTLLQLLDPPRRVRRFALIANPDRPSDFDQTEVGWRIDPAPPSDPPAHLRIVDPTVSPGLDNGGHMYGAELAPDERADLIEYLKTL